MTIVVVIMLLRATVKGWVFALYDVRKFQQFFTKVGDSHNVAALKKYVNSIVSFSINNVFKFSTFFSFRVVEVVVKG